MALIAYQATLLITGAFTATALNIIGLVGAIVIIIFITYMLVRPAKDKKGKRVNV